MPNEKLYSHIHLRGLGAASRNFRAPGGGDKPAPPRIPNRSEHASLLREQLESALSQLPDFLAAQKQVGVPSDKRGMPITVTSRPGISLVTGGTRANSRGLKLYAVRRGETDLLTGEATDQATYFLGDRVAETFRENLDKYGEWIDTPEALLEFGKYDEFEEGEDGGAGRRPRNFWLFESGAEIRPATLRDLWTDDVDAFPRGRGAALWEIWVRTALLDPFRKAAAIIGVRDVGRPTEFVETVVQNVRATPTELQTLLRSTGAIVELRKASSFVSDFLDMTPTQRSDLGQSLQRRIVQPPAAAPRVTILDTGVDRSHPLLSHALPANRCHTAEPSWGTSDRDGHGTRMAGLALIGDLGEAQASTGPILLTTDLESVVVAAPQPPGDLPARDAIERAVAIVERENAKRVYCLAQTAVGESETGRPTSTSAVLDKLAFGDGESTRLFCAAVGNVPHTPLEPYQVADYTERNARFGIQSPGQAVNALSVGAASLKPTQGPDLLAPSGDLMPTSRTAASWRRPHASKPDIVMEGGNLRIDRAGGNLFALPALDHFALTTSQTANGRMLAVSGETSTATALAAGLAARVAARYPLFRMETIRGLMVHCADWTPAMLANAYGLRAAGMPEAEVWQSILGRYGWGVPDEGRLFASASNALTLVVEDELTPYERQFKDGRRQPPRLREMKYFKLPWPAHVLRDLRSTEVEMRCTLSYFIDPDPHAAARDRIDRYPSHRLKFDVRRYGETDARAQRRLNLLAAGSDGEGSTSDEGWLTGAKNRGTVVQDFWRGPAYRLAERDGISVAPVRGWWADAPNEDRMNRPVRFSLIVSVRTPAQSGDLVSEAMVKVSVATLVQAAVALV